MASEDEAREFGRVFRGFLEWVHADAGGGRANPVVTRVRDHLRGEGDAQSVVSRTFPPFEHVNVQVALDRWAEHPGREVVVEGVSMPPHYGPFSLQHLVLGEGLPPVRFSAPELVDLPSGPGRTTACVRSALFLVQEGDARFVVFVHAADPRHGEEQLTVEVAGLTTTEAQLVLGELERLRSEHNVYRGQVLELVQGQMGISIAFPQLTPTAREDVVLPEQVLHRIERHTLHVAARREALRSAGQHLKRGLLLYGPPGTGKTHTTRYVVQHLPGTTVLLLSGRALHLVGAMSQLARELAPSAVVLEDVDLVAEDRGHGMGSSPVLFELLDAMDGSAADADLLFLLTTNRADLLEPALAARPGRVDVAVEIGLPDTAARRRLLEVYSRGVPLAADEATLAQVVERCEGVTASFIKELVRRAVLESLARTGSEHLEQVGSADLVRALDDLLDGTQSVTRALLGVPDAAGEAPGPTRTGHGNAGWLAAKPGLHPGGYI